MPDRTPARRHTLRWIALGVAAVLLVVVVALLIHVQRLLQPERFTRLLENNLAAVGLKLRMQAPAEPTLFPHPGVQLQGFSLANAHSDTPMLQAAGATVVVPWRTLLRGDVAIERVEVNAPRIDLDELQALLARLPHRAGPPRLPTIATGISMTHGTLLRGGKPLLFDCTIATGELVPGRAFALVASARTDAGQRLTATVAMVPSARAGAIDLESLRVELGIIGGAQLHLVGRGQWQGGDRLGLQLRGNLAHAALAPAGAQPSASAATAPTSTTSDAITLVLRPARAGTPPIVTLKLDGDDAHVDASMRPTEFDGWWTALLASKPGQAPLPLPFTGKATVRTLDLGWLKASGLVIEADPDLAPAPAASTAAPAASTSAATPR